MSDSPPEKSEAEPLPLRPLNHAEVVPDDGDQDVSQDPDAVYESEVDDDLDA